MHLLNAHALWKENLQETDLVIDATCGNGKDTAVLAQLVPHGHVWALDIQEKALQRAQSHNAFKNVTYLLQNHEILPDIHPLALVVYNLGYLPGGDKRITTRRETTLKSIECALARGASVSIVCYPGHPEGAKEQEILLNIYRGRAGVTHYQWDQGAPSLLWIDKFYFNLKQQPSIN